MRTGQLKPAGLAIGTGLIVVLTVTVIMLMAGLLDGSGFGAEAPGPLPPNIIEVDPVLWRSVSDLAQPARPSATGCDVAGDADPRLPLIDTNRCMASDYIVTVE